MIRRLITLLAVWGLLVFGAIAQDQAKLPTDDLIASNLEKSRDEYQAAIGEARDKLLAAFDTQQKKIEEDNAMKVEQQIKLVKELQLEKKSFESGFGKASQIQMDGEGGTRI